MYNMVVQTYKTSLKSEPKGDAELYSQLGAASSEANLVLGGSIEAPQILKIDPYTKETLSDEAFEARIYDLGANLWIGEEYKDLVAKLTSSYGKNFMEALSPEYEKILASDADKINHYAAEGIIEPVLGERTEYIEFDGKIVGSVTEPTGYTNYKFTKEGEKFLRENPENNPELRDLTGGSTPHDEKKKRRWGRIGAATTALLFGGAATVSMLPQNQYAEPTVHFAPFNDGDNSTGIVNGYDWDHNDTPTPDDDMVTIDLLYNITSQGVKAWEVPNGTDNKTSQQLLEELDWIAYPYEAFPNNGQLMHMINVTGNATTGVANSVEFLGAYTGYTNHTSPNNNPKTTSISNVANQVVLLEDGQPFFIRGIEYHPIMPGMGGSHNWMENKSVYNYSEDLAEMAAYNANTIIIKAPRNFDDGLGFLDDAHNESLRVMVELGAGWDEDNITAKERANRTVSGLMNHSSIVAWGTGSYVPGDNVLNDELAPYVKQLDPNHIVTAMTNLSNFQSADQNLTNVDAIVVQAYGANLSTVWSAINGASHPVIVLHGASSYNASSTQQDQAMQSAHLLSQIRDIRNNSAHLSSNDLGIIGNCIETWSDQHWMSDSNPRDPNGSATLDDVLNEHMGEHNWTFVNGSWELVAKQSKDSIIIGYDFNKPTPQILNHTPLGAHEQDWLMVNGSGSDNLGMEQLIYYVIDNKTGAINKEISVMGNQSEVNASGLADGDQRVVVKAIDNSGNENTTEIQGIITDNVAPVAWLTPRTTPEFTSNNYIFVEVEAPSDVTNIDIELDDESYNLIDARATTGSNISHNFTNLQDGKYILIVDTGDYFHSNQQWIYDRFTVDRGLPVLYFSDPTPAEGENPNIDQFVANLTVLDPNLNHTVLELHNETDLVQSFNGSGNITQLLAGLMPGNYTIVGKAWDKAGNFNQTQRAINVTDTIPPWVIFENDTELAGDYENKTNVFANVSGWDKYLDYLEIELSNATNNDARRSPANFSANFTGLGWGSHDLVARARDTSGNMNQTSVRTFNLFPNQKPGLRFENDTLNNGTYENLTKIRYNLSAWDNVLLKRTNLKVWNETTMLANISGLESLVGEVTVPFGNISMKGEALDHIDNFNETETWHYTLLPPQSNPGNNGTNNGTGNNGTGNNGTGNNGTGNNGTGNNGTGNNGTGGNGGNNNTGNETRPDDPENETRPDDGDGSDGGDEDEGWFIPGFEVTTLAGAMGIGYVIHRKRRKPQNSPE